MAALPTVTSRLSLTETTTPAEYYEYEYVEYEYYDIHINDNETNPYYNFQYWTMGISLSVIDIFGFIANLIVLGGLKERKKETRPSRPIRCDVWIVGRIRYRQTNQ